MQPSQRSGDGPSQVAIDVALSAQLSDYDGRRDGAFSNIGRVAMRRRTAAVLERSALLTSLVRLLRLCLPSLLFPGIP